MSEDETFLFNSGGRYHPSPWGEWDVFISRDGQYSITQFIGDEIPYSGMFTVPKEENEKIWNIIKEIGFEQIKSSSRPGVPDEVEFRFDLKKAEQEISIILWRNDADKIEKIKNFLPKLKEIIEKYTKKKPVF
jgi:hypothetical protein